MWLLLVKLILGENPDCDIFIVEKCGLLVATIDGKGTVTLRHDSTWTEVKRHVRVISDGSDTFDCPLCTESRVIRFACSKCAGIVWCYANIFKARRGSLTCPFCRDIVGPELPDFLVRVKYKYMIKVFQSKQSVVSSSIEVLYTVAKLLTSTTQNNHRVRLS